MSNREKFSFGAIITVRTSSKRLKKKCHQKIYKNKSLLEIVIERAKKINAKVIVATSKNPSDNDIEKVALEKNVSVFRGSLKNKIHRWHSCFKDYKLDYAILVDADDPTFCFSIMNNALDRLVKFKADIICGSKSLLPGLITYGISKRGIQKLYLTAKNSKTDTDVIDVFLRRAKLNFLKIKPRVKEEYNHDIRLTVDYLEDLNFYKEIYKKISYLESSSKIIKFIKKNNLAKINWYRNNDFKINQINFNKKLNKKNE